MSSGNPAPSTPRVLLASQPTGAGTARHVADLAAGILADGFDVTVACPSGGMLNERLAASGVPVIELQMVREISPLADVRSFFALYRLCKRLKPDVLHGHSSKAGFLVRLVGHFAGVPVVMFTPHCWSFQSATGRKRAFYLRLERFASRFCDLTVAVSQKEADEAVEEGVLAPQRIRVIRNGVAAHDFTTDDTAEKDISFLSVGRLDEQKGYSYLIEAMADLVKAEPDAQLTIVGDGAERPKLESLTETLGIGASVIFEGEQPNAAPYLARAKAFVLSSLWEGLPYTIIEAMAAALPVISTDVGGCAELVHEGETGLLVAPKDVHGLSSAMGRLVRNPEFSQRLGASGQAFAREHLRIEDCVASNERAYEEMFALKSKASPDVGPAALFGRWGAALLLLVITVFLVAAIGDQIANRDRIARGVHIGGLDVGGQKLAEAQETIDAVLARPVYVSLPGDQAPAPLNTDVLGIEARVLADKAYAIGRVGALPRRYRDRVDASKGAIDIPVEASLEASVAELISAARLVADRAPSDAGFEFEDGKVVVVPSRPGATVDDERFLAELGRAALSVSAADRRVRLPMADVAAQASDDDASDYLAQARFWLSAPITAELDEASVRFSPQEFAGMLTVAGDGLGVSASEIADALTSRRIGRKAPKPARFSVSQGVPVIVDGTLGAKVDGTATAEAARKALAAGDKRFEIRLRDVEPDITKSDLAGLGIRKELASFTTRFDPDVDGRDENIALAAGAVRGKVLGEGEVFSLNKTTGPRGRTSGYKEALVFMKGKVVPGVGGGVCQVSSTLYNGALLAGLKIVERHSHSMAVSYVIPGRDATAYYPTIDLKFQNTTGSPIMIWTEVGDGTLTVKVFGSTKRPDVQIITDVRKTIRQGKHVVHDRTIPHNEYRVDSAGIPGYVVSSFRIFRENGRVLKREPLATDEYRPREAVIRVGI